MLTRMAKESGVETPPLATSDEGGHPGRDSRRGSKFAYGGLTCASNALGKRELARAN